MNIDLNNKSALLLKSSKNTILQALHFLNSLKRSNVSNIYFELTRTLQIKDVDIDFILHFLHEQNYISFEKEIVFLKKPFNSNRLINDLLSYYLALILSNHEINSALFLHSEFTIKNDSIIINVESVSLLYRPYFLVLQNLELMKVSEIKGYNIISNYAIAKKILERPLRKISQKEFEKELEGKKNRGIKAELFVLLYEHNKLRELSYKPKRVSEENVGLGYDIESYETSGKNIFIEVKSLVRGRTFFWSKNEIEVAKKLGQHYLIYAVLFDNHGEPEKLKEIITNPYKQIFDLKKYEYTETGDYCISLFK